MNQTMAQASESLEGTISFRRNSNNPCICLKNEAGEFEWKNINHISGSDFIRHREQFNDTLKKWRRQISQAQHKYDTVLSRQLVYLPHPNERALMKEMFRHIPTDIKSRLIIEFKSTIIGTSWCHICMNATFNKQHCLHFECPGMCEGCYENLDHTCLACHRGQEIDCPICRESKTAKDLHTLENCHHSICLKCFTNASLAKKPLTRCPVCRADF